MKFTGYISVSFIFHMTLMLLLGMVSFSGKTATDIFDVDIVAPFEAHVPVPLKKPLPVQKISPPEKHILPDKLYDDNTIVSSKEDNALETIKRDERSDEKNNSAQVPALKDSESSKERADVRIVPPSALFDRKTINKFASKSPADDKGLTFEAPEFRNRGYMRLLKEKIESIWKYPREAARTGKSGDLYIKFNIKKDGRLGNVELVRTSGYRELDEAAIKALKDAQPYWPLPDDIEKEELEIIGHFIYVYGTTYVM